jgi:hypothetical protein
VYLKEGYSDAILEQCRRIGCGGKDTTMNYMSCLMSLTLSNTGIPHLALLIGSRKTEHKVRELFP